MGLILTIDTSTEKASICLAENGEALCLLLNEEQRDHASWIHLAIQQALQQSGKTLTELKAVAVTSGPGSYTGLRVGMATAKGLCYALNIPFISINTLYAMAFAAKNASVDFICPMIDARRMEVFTALYDKELNELIEPSALILEPPNFEEFLSKGKVLFFGSGSFKWGKILNHSSAFFDEINFNASNITIIAHEKLISGNYSPLAYSEPVYIKDFYMPVKG